MFFLLSKVLDLLFSPYTWGLGLMALALQHRKARRPLGPKRRVLSLVGFGVLLVFSLDPMANRLTRACEGKTVRGDITDKRYDGVILLGGVLEDRAMFSSGQRAYNGNVERLLATYDLLRKDVARVVIVSGSSPTARPGTVEANVLADQLADWGIARERIVLEDRSLNTRENAVFSMKIANELGLQKLLLVTSASHMVRALGCFRAVGAVLDPYAVDFRSYDPASFPTSFQPRVEYLARSTEMLRELFGRTIYGWKGFAVYD
jgi:uncharacterized SAM-binding protein YcdF (DUF218 family)